MLSGMSGQRRKGDISGHLSLFLLVRKMPYEFPKYVTVRVIPPSEGLAVLITLEMSRKNRFDYIAFVAEDGVAKVSESDLLKWFNAERSLFAMDYVDPRSAYTGRVFARVLTNSELESAIKSFELYRKYTWYPEGHEGKLRAALSRGQDPKNYSVEVDTA